MTDLSRSEPSSRAANPETMDPTVKLGGIANVPRASLEQWDDAATSTVWCDMCQQRLAQLPNIRSPENMARPKYCPICKDELSQRKEAS